MAEIKTEIKGSSLVITVDVSKEALTAAPISSSGKSKTVASTRGFVVLPNGMKMGLNVISSLRG